MKSLILILSIATFVLCNEANEQDSKKRAVQSVKQNNLNSIPGNTQQKPGDVTYIYQQQSQQGPVHAQGPVYPQTNPNNQNSIYSTLQGPVAPNNLYLQHDLQNYFQQGGLNFGVPSVFPLQFVPQPKLQIVPNKLPNGQTQYSVVPQQNFLYPQNLYQNYQQNQPLQQTTQSSYLPNHAQNQQQYQANPFYNQPHILGQPSSMFVLSQPGPQLYANYLNPNPNLLYSNSAQQLLNYYQTNPQAKYQLLYGNNPNNFNANPGAANNNYQPQLSGTEYDKILPGPISQNIAKGDSDNSLNTNEYYAQESQFKPVNSYGNRVGSSYKP